MQGDAIKAVERKLAEWCDYDGPPPSRDQLLMRRGARSALQSLLDEMRAARDGQPEPTTIDELRERVPEGVQVAVYWDDGAVILGIKADGRLVEISRAGSALNRADFAVAYAAAQKMGGEHG